MKIAHLELWTGVAGDMFVGAMLDAGWPEERLQALVAKLGIEDLRVVAEDRYHSEIRGRGIRVLSSETQPRRGLPEIRGLVERAALSPRAAELAIRVFEKIAVAEARVHGVPVDTIHFHEIGALDSIVDIVGSVQAVVDLSIDELTASPIPIGRGTVRMEHGVLPVPAPATAMLLEGWPILSVPDEGEFVTPTGAALLSVLARPAERLPSMRVERVGWGAGTKSHPRLPNLIRLWVGEIPGTLLGPGFGTDASRASLAMVAVLETQVDDFDPRWLAVEAEGLREAGALDVFLEPVHMKKGRLGTRLTAIVSPEDADRLALRLLERTPTLGVRVREERRWQAARQEGWVETSLGRVRVKWVRSAAGWTARAEADEIVRLAAQRGESPARVAEALLRALDGEKPAPEVHEG